MHLIRVSGNPLIHPGTDSSVGLNINGPSMIRVPDWEPSPSEPPLYPEAPWEGGNLAPHQSSGGAIHAGVRALRDPSVFEEEGRTLILYSTAGECGIAAAELHEQG